MTRSRFHPLTITAVDRLCEDAVAVTLEPPAAVAPRFGFQPGQHLNVRRCADGVEHRRSYSICAPSGTPLRIAARRVPGGTVSGWLVDTARPGDVLEAEPPQGRFTVDATAGGRHVMVAAGSGITPVLSLAGSLLAASDAHVTLVYGNRRSATAMFLEELADLKDRHPARFELLHVLSREPRDAELFSGRLDGPRLERILTALVPVAAVDGWWLCGPFGMVEEHRTVLARLGVPRRRVHAELFHVDSPPPAVVHADEVRDGPAYSLTFTLDGLTTTVTGSQERTLLETAQAARPDVPFACRGGVCGTCRARITQGEAPMRRNYALEDDELDRGFVLCCQAVPRTDTVTVDFDA